MTAWVRADDAAPAASSTARSWEMPPITVVGKNTGGLGEEERIGSYEQPRWTADRLFARNRVYVIPEDEVEFEYWIRADVPKHDGPTELQQMFEVELGLPHRFQLDLYGIIRSEGNAHTFFDQAIELRYALADWGKLPGNPAFYLEYFHGAEISDKIEGKLLLAGDVAPGWHWATNLVYEAEVSDLRTHEYSATVGLSHTVIDRKLDLGIEAEFAVTDERGNRGDFTREAYVGPSLQWRPRPNMHVDFAPLVGVNHSAEAAKIFFIFGYEF